jgi:hypothetical protein
VITVSCLVKFGVICVVLGSPYSIASCLVKLGSSDVVLAADTASQVVISTP